MTVSCVLRCILPRRSVLGLRKIIQSSQFHENRDFLMDFHENLTIREWFATAHQPVKIFYSAIRFFKRIFCLFRVHPKDCIQAMSIRSLYEYTYLKMLASYTFWKDAHRTCRQSAVRRPYDPPSDT